MAKAKIGDKIKIISTKEMDNLGYNVDWKEIYDHADKEYTVRDILDYGDNLYHYLINEVMAVHFIDADFEVL